MLSKTEVLLVTASLLGRLVHCQSVLKQESLSEYPLAVCNDGSPAVYYHEEFEGRGEKVMLYLADDEASPCSTKEECLRKCQRRRESCTASSEEVIRLEDSIWIDDRRNNPVANYVKVLLLSCSSDEFSGTRGASDLTGGIAFHGRHILTAVLRDLVTKFGLDRASDILLVGSGSGARAAARQCDFLSSAVRTVSEVTRVRCVFDGPDFVPFWLNQRCRLDSIYERQKFLWAREDDESCVRESKDTLNSTELARQCGIFGRYYLSVTTPFFVITNQFDRDYFAATTCSVSQEDEEYQDYEIGWRQGMIALAQSLSLNQPGNGWFIPNCNRMSTLLKSANIKQRKEVRVHEFDSNGDVNVLQTLNNWLTTGEKHQAIDAFAIPNQACNHERSQPLDLRPDILRRDEELRRERTESAFGKRRRGPSVFFRSNANRFAPPPHLFPGFQNDFFDYDGLSLGPEFDFHDSGIGFPDRTSFSGVDVPVGPHVANTPYDVAPTRRFPLVAHTPRRRARLWRKLFYLDYLRRTYARHYHDYHAEYYGTGVPVGRAHVPGPGSQVVPGLAFARIQKDESAGGDVGEIISEKLKIREE